MLHFFFLKASLKNIFFFWSFARVFTPGLRARKIVEQLIRDAGAAYTPDTLLSCPTCGFSRTKSRLTSHIKWVHREADIPCEYLGCKWSFKRRTEMRQWE